jgi:hypothetical protein
MRSRLILTAFCLFIITAAAERAEACSCLGGEAPCQALGTAAAVFVGTVMEMKEQPRLTIEEARKRADAGELQWAQRRYKFSVERWFSGGSGPEAEVATGFGGGDCGYEFERGVAYIVYANGGEGGKPLTTSICSRTKRLQAADEDLEFLRNAAAREPGVVLTGTVLRSRKSLRDDRRTTSSPLADAALVLEGVEGRQTTRTDAQGRYSFRGLKAGTYRLRLQLPEVLTVHRPDYELRVSSRGCASHDFEVFDNGRISGTTSDETGQPAAGVLLTLRDAADFDNVEAHAMYARTDGEGRYSFEGVPPGRYVIAVNMTRYPEYKDPTNAFPRVYYPGVLEPTAAGVITVGEGEAVAERDLRLPAPRAAREIELQVVWEDGQPVPNASVTFRDVTQHERSHSYGERADEEGRLKLRGYEGQVYVVEARSNRPFVGDRQREGPMERTAPVRLVLGKSRTPARLVIHKLR